MEYTTWVNRAAGGIARVLARTRITPNQVTVLGLLFGVGSGVVFSAGDHGLNDIAALLFVIAVFMDEIDGALARESGRTTRFGHNLDYYAGTATFCALFVGVGVGMSTLMAEPALMYLGIAAAIAAFLSMLIKMKIEDERGSAAVRYPHALGFELKDGVYLFAPLTWFGELTVFFIAASISTCIYTMWVALGFVRIMRPQRNTPPM